MACILFGDFQANQPELLFGNRSFLPRCSSLAKDHDKFSRSLDFKRDSMLATSRDWDQDLNHEHRRVVASKENSVPSTAWKTSTRKDNQRHGLYHLSMLRSDSCKSSSV